MTFRIPFYVALFVGGLTLGAQKPENVCWGDNQCAPVSIVRATFDGYATGGPPPTYALRQDLITVQSQLAEEMRKLRECQGILGPLQSRLHGDLLKGQQEELNKLYEAAAPPGMAWDGRAGRYVTKPPEQPAPTGRGAGSY